GSPTDLASFSKAAAPGHARSLQRPSQALSCLQTGVCRKNACSPTVARSLGRQPSTEERRHMRGFPGQRDGLVTIHFVVDSATATQRWLAGASQGQQRFVEGVQSTTKDPTQLAQAAAPKLLANFTQAVTSGRWAR